VRVTAVGSNSSTKPLKSASSCKAKKSGDQNAYFLPYLQTDL
jgi:hypothetical protein